MTESICRSYLWTGSTTLSREALVAWETLCLSYSAGGVNVLNLIKWNKAAVAKHLWALTKKKDSLWIKCVHTFYIKNYSIDDMPVLKSAAWAIRKIFELRELIKGIADLQGNLDSRLLQLQRGDSFSIKKLYRFQHPQYHKVQRKSIILEAQLHPRCKLILWLALHKRMTTIDRLRELNILIPQEYTLSGLSCETFDHLYFDCSQTKALWSRLLNWLCYKRPISDWNNECEYVSKLARKRTGVAEITACLFGILVTMIRREQNKQRFQGGKMLHDNVCKEIAIHLYLKGASVYKWKVALLILDHYP